MMELATKTMTADKTMGIQRAESETIGSLLRAQKRMRKFSLRGYPRAGRGSSRFARSAVTVSDMLRPFDDALPVTVQCVPLFLPSGRRAARGAPHRGIGPRFPGIADCGG